MGIAMQPLQLAQRYLEIFFSGKNMERLLDLFQPDLSFEGPFLKTRSAQEYVQSLKADPPIGLDYKILSSYESESSACIIYKFSKPGISTVMVQQFEVKEGRIAKILLVFDTRDFV